MNNDITGIHNGNYRWQLCMKNNNDITEAHIGLSYFTCKIMGTLNFFSINFNKNENKFLSLAYWYRNDNTV